MNRAKLILVAAVCVFGAQAISSHVLRRDPYLPSPPSLVNIPQNLGNWSQLKEETIEPEAIQMLGPDDYLARLYQEPGSLQQAELFVAYYKTQLRSKNAHDPKVCLPGAGWNPTESKLSRVATSGTASIPVNYYRIKKNESEQVVLYWFQTFKGVYTQEQQLSAHRVWDALTDNRTDVALVRITVPVTSTGVSQANERANRLAQVVYNQMLSYFPPTEKSRS